MITSLRRLLLPFVLLSLAACATPDPLTEELVEMGNFKLAHNVVVAEKAVLGPLSREADEGSWEIVLKDEIDRRFGRHEGDKLYHLGVSVDAYVLALPGVPLVASPKSILIMNVTVWDDAAGKKLNEEPERITVLESLSGETVVSSGLTQSKEQQQRNLSRNGAKAIQKWLLEHPEWFDIDKDAAKKAAAEIEVATVDADKLAAEEAAKK